MPPAIATGRVTTADNAKFALLMTRATESLVVFWIMLLAIHALTDLKPALD